MPMTLEGSCHCGAVRFSLESHTPYPYQRCYCSICRKTAGGGYAVNLMGVAGSLALKGTRLRRIYHATIERDGKTETSAAERHFCGRCATALWLYDARWPDLIHPFAACIDTALPAPPSLVHLMLRFKAPWVAPNVGPQDACFDEYPELSIEDWHRTHGLWID